MPVPAAPDPDTTATDAERPERDRRAVAALVAGVAVVVLALGGLTYTLLDNGDGGNGAGPDERSAAVGSPAETGGGARRTAGSGSAAPSATASGSGPATRAPQSVTVNLAGAGTAYEGSCPPPHGRTPAFTATFTVDRLPAQVSYRWVSRDGEVLDPGWKTLSFPEGGGRTRQDTALVTAYDDGGTYENAVSVEVRSPVRTAAGPVPFSVTCVTETPTDEVSASVTPSP
jgi:hypothetical protein